MKRVFYLFLMMTFVLVINYQGKGQKCGIEGVELRKAVVDGRVDSVWQGYGLPAGYSGKDVIIGFTDWGFDYTNPVFYDTTMTHYRVLRAWDQYRTGGPHPSGFNYGTELVGQAELLQAQCDTFNVYEYNYHGNHVASIAGGSGGGSPYRGVAFDANLLFVSIVVSEQAIIDAFQWMYQVAQAEQKRLVINMSWGLYYMNNLDGTGRLSEVMESLSNQGVVFVTSGGNNGDVNFHLHHSFSGPADTLKSQFNFSSGSSAMWGASISMCNDVNAPFSFALQVMDNAYSPLEMTPFYNTADGDAYIDTFILVNNDTVYYNINIEQSDPYNQRPEVRFRIKQPDVSGYKMGLFVTALSGDFHALNLIELSNDVGNWGGSFVKPALYSDWVGGDAEYGLGAPANVDCAITVAAHQSRTQNNYGVWVGGAIADFSSSGPTVDNRMKPEISAPGKNVISAISSFTNQYNGNYSTTVSFQGRTYPFVPLSGTSMSSPFVAGVAALILQANPYLTPAQVKDVLLQTAYQDQFTEQAGVNRFGHGKVDAYHAIQYALQLVGTEEYEVNESRYSLYPNPVDNQLYVSVQSDQNEVLATIYDITGRVVMKQLLAAGVNIVNVSSLKKGCYFIHLYDSKTIETKKIIKH